MAARKWKRTRCYIFSRYKTVYILCLYLCLYLFQALLSDGGMTEIVNFQKLWLCSKVTPNLKSMEAKICPILVCLWGKHWFFRSFFAFSLKHPLKVVWIIILFHLVIVTNNYWKPETQGCATKRGRDFSQWIKPCKKQNLQCLEFFELDICI